MEEELAESQGFDRAVHVDAEKTWTDAIVASLSASDSHVSDEEIFKILTARGEGQTAADLCAAKNVTIPMYCVWKTKYRGLNVEEIGKARRRELWRARGLAAALLATVVLGAGALLFGLVRAAQANTTVEAGSSPAGLPATPRQMERASSSVAAGSESVPPDKVLAAVPATPSRTEDSGVSRAASDERVTSAKADGDAKAAAPGETTLGPTPPTTAPQYNVQVTAAATLEEGRMLVDRLAAAGHPAYVSAAIVKDVEVFRVRVGPFDVLEEAKEVSLSLQRNGHPDAWIVR